MTTNQTPDQNGQANDNQGHSAGHNPHKHHNGQQGAEQIAESVKLALQNFSADFAGSQALLANVYDEHVVFQDPIQRLHGKGEFLAANERLIARAKELRFVVIDTVAHADQIFLTWSMLFHPKLGPTMHFDGVTHLRVRNGKVAEHRDYWDLLGGVADSIPGVGPLYRTMIAKLG